MTRGPFRAALLIVLTGCRLAQAAQPAQVDEQRIVHAEREPGNWLIHGRTYDEQRFSPLELINDRNVNALGLVWFADLSMHRGEEATPLAIDGVLYVSTAWSTVRAFDGKTGAALWTYDPQVPKDTLVKACCDGVNRGVAAWGGAACNISR